MAVFDKKKLQKMKKIDFKDKKHTIMLIDDEMAHLSSMKSMLSEDYHIITACDGQEALDLIKNMENPENISLIISDQRMPRLTGIKLFEELLHILPKTIRIILTGFVDIPVILDSINKTKIYQFIQKPFEPEDLKLRIINAIRAFETEKKIDEYRIALEERNRELEKKNKELEILIKKFEESSLIDPITGLRNFQYIQKFIHLDISKIQRYYENNLKNFSNTETSQYDMIFLILDPDNFKSINDMVGIEIGNMVLKELADILKNECRQSDILVRWSGDEFLSVICLNDRTQAQQQAECLRHAIEKHQFNLGRGKTLRLTCSIGFVPYPFLHRQPKLINPENTISLAIEALRVAKNSGGNAWVGFMGTDSTKTENLFPRILKNINEMITNGELKVLTSIKEKKR